MVFNHKVVAALGVVLMVASGCGKKEAGDEPVDTAGAKSAAVQQSMPSASETSLAYYEANLDKAKSVWADCQEAGPDDMTESRIKSCKNARHAWMHQPYKPKPSTFSSSGGRN